MDTLCLKILSLRKSGRIGPVAARTDSVAGGKERSTRFGSRGGWPGHFRRISPLWEGKHSVPSDEINWLRYNSGEKWDDVEAVPP
jgi:hypothetical protein